MVVARSKLSVIPQDAPRSAVHHVGTVCISDKKYSLKLDVT